jgi:SulP family sulfate permease
LQTPIAAPAPAFAAIRREIIAGVTVACITPPMCIAAGVLVYSPLGSAYIPQGAAAGLYGAVFAGLVAALVASSSFIVTAPAASVCILLAALVSSLAHDPAFAAHPHWVVLAVAICALLAGVLQTLFGILDLGRIIKFTPHPVQAGFTNSVALLLIFGPLRSFFQFGPGGAGSWFHVNRPGMLVFVVALAGFVYLFANWNKKLPAPLVGLLVGAGVFYALGLIFPGLDLGPTIGSLPATFPPVAALLDLDWQTARPAFVAAAPYIAVTSVTVAVITTLQALMCFRSMQNLADLPPRPKRDLIAQGLANCASAVVGGLASYPPPGQAAASYRAGGRTRVAPITAALVLLVLVLFLAPLFARIPVGAFSAILIFIGIQLFDRWSLRLLRDALRNHPKLDRVEAWQSLSVVAIVMLVTAASSIVAGALAGFVLACLIFIMRMSRPIVRRRYGGEELFSKRMRSVADMETLRRTGARRVVLELQGVLFFGNADDLSRIVSDLMADRDMILFDLRGISDIDVSGATILGDVVARSRKRGKTVVFCNVPAARPDLATAIAQANAVEADLDRALEWMEEAALRAAADARPASQAIPLAALDLFKDLDAAELAIVRGLLVARDFPAGAVMCGEGESADRMWILTKGSVSVRLQAATANDRRIAGVGAGTTVGEMALFEGGRKRAATVVCDEDVSSYELDLTAFETIVLEHPQIARKLFTYFARVLVGRVRMLHQDLRTLIA